MYCLVSRAVAAVAAVATTTTTTTTTTTAAAAVAVAATATTWYVWSGKTSWWGNEASYSESGAGKRGSEERERKKVFPMTKTTTAKVWWF